MVSSGHIVIVIGFYSWRRNFECRNFEWKLPGLGF